jgi:hypothetical protein
LTEPEASEAPRDSPARHALIDETWEFELLISGALVFGLLQVPGLASSWWRYAQPSAEGDLRLLYFLGYYYVTLLSYTLIATFSLHLVARAYWVALRGLRSVFPDGPDWERATSRGPISSSVLRQRVPTLTAAVARSDDAASLIYSFGFVVLGGLLASLVWASVIGVVVGLLHWLLPFDFSGLVLALIAFVVLLAPVQVAAIIDYRYGARLDRGGVAARAVRAVLHAGYWLNLGPIFYPLSLTFATRVPARVFIPLTGAVTALMVGMFLVSNLVLDESRVPVNSFLLEPARRSGLAVDFRLYANLRPAGEVFRREPFIQSDVVAEPYVRLFVPYYPHLDNEVLERTCPDVIARALAADANDRGGEIESSALECLTTLHQVLLDGALLDDPEFHFHEAHEWGVRGLLAYIPTAGLAPGRHEIRIRRVEAPTDRLTPEGPAMESGADSADTDADAGVDAAGRESGQEGDADDSGDAPLTWVIPFWL